MSTRFHAPVALLACIVLASCQSTPPPEDDAPVVTADTIEQGRQFALTHCAACHAVGVKDVSRRREALPFRNLSRRYPVSDLADSLADGIMTGDADMPEWRLTPDEIAALLAYMSSIQRAPR